MAPALRTCVVAEVFHLIASPWQRHGYEPSQKLHGYFLDERKKTERETVGEWFQWLAERFAEREGKTSPVPAYVEYRDWRPR